LITVLLLSLLEISSKLLLNLELDLVFVAQVRTYSLWVRSASQPAL
jgi:hypothetical protein